MGAAGKMMRKKRTKRTKRTTMRREVTSTASPMKSSTTRKRQTLEPTTSMTTLRSTAMKPLGKATRRS